MKALDRLRPVQREPTASLIADQLRERILDGTFAPGAQLGEVELARRLDVSRGPLREALSRLAQEGLVRSERHRGVFVVSLDDADVCDVYLARSAVERAAARALVRGGRRDAFAELERIVERMAAAAARGAWRQAIQADLLYHERLVALARSDRLVRMYRTLLAEVRLCLGALETAEVFHPEYVVEHRQIVQAMRDGDERRTLALIDAHLESAVSDLLRIRGAPAQHNGTDGDRP